MRGVNLGGWLVGEYWMTAASPAWNGVPTDVANHGEFKTMQYLGRKKQHIDDNDQRNATFHFHFFRSRTW